MVGMRLTLKHALLTTLAIGLGAAIGDTKAQRGDRGRYLLANGARLYVADWGGEGPVLLFMPGFGNGAHIFDSIAPAFTDHFHVAALTPRGFPPSSAPDSGYTIAQLASDVRVILDSLGGTKAVLVGHSISGAVITQFAEAYPDRLLAAVYLDAAFDFGETYRRSRAGPIRGPPRSADTAAPTYRAWKARFPNWDAVRERDAQMWRIDSTEVVRRQTLVMALANEVRSRPHEVWRVRAPTLVVCAVGSMERFFGWLTPDSTRWQLASDYAEQGQAAKRAECDDIGRRLPQGQALTLESSHYVFLDRRAQVISAMSAFFKSAIDHAP
jgi:pimeloyl-ACP methyl ester carboxylesterase